MVCTLCTADWLTTLYAVHFTWTRPDMSEGKLKKKIKPIMSFFFGPKDGTLHIF